MSKKFTYSKEERIKSPLRVNQVFAEGIQAFSHPFKYYFVATPTTEEEAKLMVCFSVPKKRYKRATDRNKIKRLCKENFRLNKEIFYNKAPAMKMEVYFIFIGKEMPDYHEVEKGMKSVLNSISNHIIAG